jgi:hypothetical protein
MKLPTIKTFTDADKCNAFDRIRKICLQQAKDTLAKVGDDNLSDGENFIYETAMKETLDPDIFTTLNRYR